MPIDKLIYRGPENMRVADHAVVALTLDSNGNPVPLSGSGGGGLPAGASTEAKQTEQITQAGGIGDGILARKGSDFIADTSAHSGSYIGFVVITDAEIDDITLGSGSSGAAALTAKTLYAGQQVLVPFTSITLTSGTVQLVKA